MTERVVICGANWLGDSVMSMPAIQVFKARFPSIHLSVAVRPDLCPLWAMHDSPDAILALAGSTRQTVADVRGLRAGGYGRAFVFPNSFRSALLPALAGIPDRVGMAGHSRRILLTRVVVGLPRTEKRHQSWEYASILGLEDLEALPAPALSPVLTETTPALKHIVTRLGDDPAIGLFPGAARGDSKQWPLQHFAALGRSLAGHGYRVLIMGTASDADAGDALAGQIGSAAVNVAGATKLPELATLLCKCRVVVANDSGGMHLASALGVPVVGIFGLTDPDRTGPLGARSQIVVRPGTRGNRDIPRRSRQAQTCLESIMPETVQKAVEAELVGGAPDAAPEHTP